MGLRDYAISLRRWLEMLLEQRVLQITLFALGIAFLAFVAGAAVMTFRVFPYSFFEDAFLAGDAVTEQQLQALSSPLDTNLWRETNRADSGIGRYVADQAYQGLTLFTSGHSQKAFLLNMGGEIVHEWEVPYSELWDDSAAAANPSSDEYVWVEKAHLFPNGDIIALYVVLGQTPFGYGLAKINKDSELIWKYLQSAHHDIDVGPDGQVYTLTHRIETEASYGKYGIRPPFIDDYVAVLSSSGEELKKVSVLDAFLRSEWRSFIYMADPQSRRRNILHANAIEAIEGKSEFGQIHNGRVLISMREIDTIAIVDLNLEEIVWALRGPWYRQHDPDLLDNGNVLLFDNRGGLQERGGSRILEFSPSSMEILWAYEGSVDDPFYSKIRSAQQRLPNGNTLITESDNGRIFEVTNQGQIVWEFFTPFRARHKGKDMIAVTSWAQRFARNDLEFEFNRF